MSFKQNVYDRCQKIVDERIALAHKLIKEAQWAANQDTKSSMGDKYETSREMMALEIRKAAEQLQESSKLKQVLSLIPSNLSTSQIKIGNLIYTSIGIFYLSVSLGKIELDEEMVFALSAVSPFGKQLLGKKNGDEFLFNSKNIKIMAIK